MSLSALVARAAALDKALTPGGGAGEDEGDAQLDEFSRTKKQAARHVADIRKLITERDALLEKQKGGTKETVEMSAKVRQQLRALKEDGEKLKALHLQAQEKAKKKGKGLAPGEIDHRAEVVDLVQKHITECESLEKKRFAAGSASAARADLSGAGGSASTRAAKRTAEYTDLKDLDDPEIERGLQLLAAKDKEIDDQLDKIGDVVGRLKVIATDMNQEIKMQNEMVTVITNEVDEATAHLQDLNKKLKETLESNGGATRIIVNVILLVLVLAVGVYAYTVIKGGSGGSSDGGTDTGATTIAPASTPSSG